MDELRFKLICINKTTYEPSFIENIVMFNIGDIINVTLGDDGLRLEYKSNHYGLPLKVSDVAKAFEVYNNER